MLIIMAYDDSKYEGLTGSGAYFGRAKQVEDLPDLEVTEDTAYVAHEARKGGREYRLRELYLDAHRTPFGQFGRMVRGWFDENNKPVKVFSDYWWGNQGCALPPGKVLVRGGDDWSELVSEAEYDRMQSEWKAKHPKPQAIGTMVAWWGGENLEQYVWNQIKSTTGDE